MTDTLQSADILIHYQLLHRCEVCNLKASIN